MLAANQLLQNRYRIVQQLGHGGMGAVYEAIDETFGEPIALKEIIIESAVAEQRQSILKAFEREAKSLAKARHEAIPFVRDYFSENGKQFLVMELVEGRDLGELLTERQTPFPVDDAVKWLDQLLDALDYLHNLTPPIVHRDIKPQNLKLNLRGRIRLLDFGIAKSTGVDSTVAGQTFVGATLEYSPIEQILRVIDPTFREFIILKHKTEAENVLEQTTDARCDIYSLGATFYHLLTKQPPIDSTKRMLEIWSGNADPLPDASTLNRSVPPAVAACLRKAMEIERDNRFSTADEMRRALQAAIDGEKIFFANAAVAANINKADAGAKTSAAFEIKPSTAQNTAPVFRAPESSSVETIPNTSIPPSLSAPAPTFAPIAETKHANEKTSKKSWTLPVAALGVLAFGGASAAVWVNSNSANSEKPAANKVVAPTISPTAASANSTPAAPRVEPIIAPSVEPTAKPKQSAGKTDEPQNTTVAPKTDKSSVQTPTKKSSIKKQDAKTEQDPNCVFTNSCK